MYLRKNSGLCNTFTSVFRSASASTVGINPIAVKAIKNIASSVEAYITVDEMKGRQLDMLIIAYTLLSIFIVQCAWRPSV